MLTTRKTIAHPIARPNPTLIKSVVDSIGKIGNGNEDFHNAPIIPAENGEPRTKIVNGKLFMETGGSGKEKWEHIPQAGHDKGDKSKTRNWCFTINNPVRTKEEWLVILQGKNTRYVAMGDEVGENGTPHIQGYVDFVNPHTFGGIVKIFENLAHVEKRRGSWKQASDYCKKDSKFVEFGKPPRQGARGDIDDVKDCVLENMSMNEMIDEGYINNLQQLRFAEGLKKYKETPRDPSNPPRILWYWGPTGTGKTRTAIELYPDCWLSGKNLKWWDSYDGHKHVLIDDFRKDFCTFHELLRILDRYPFKVECKGGSRELMAEVIIITCPFRPEELYEGRTEEDISQVTRRITEIRHFVGSPQLININNGGTEQKSAGNTIAADVLINNSSAIINSSVPISVMKVNEVKVPVVPSPQVFNCY